MSRIGKKIIILPEKVSVEERDGFVLIKGPKGDLSFRLPRGIAISLKEKELTVTAKNETNPSWGTARSIIDGMVYGVVNGYEKKLDIEGVGFKAQLQGNKLILNIGFSHPVEFESPAGVTLRVEKNSIFVSGFDKFLVGQVAAKIRNFKKPEPYKGKGIRYSGEIIRRKAGKKASAGA
ncbi:MAG: 50S ribosomal protein L6 [bacterium]|nr:50S ribosomal protein L6 [bacterium]